MYNQFKEIYFALDNGDRWLFEQFNLSVPRFYALKHISENPGISFTQLSILMLSDKSNITRLVRSLEDIGLVERKRRQEDRRSLSLFITSDGMNVFQQANTAHQQFNLERISRLQLDTRSFTENLIGIKHTLEQHLQEITRKGGDS